jgi:secreted lipase
MLFMAVNTLSRQYPAVQAEIDRVFTPEGKALLAKADTMCVPAMFAVIGKHNTRDLTTTGESVFDLVNRLPDVQKEIQRQRIGLRAPQVPVLMIYHQSDPLVSWEDSRALGENWQREGGTVRFVDYPRNPVADTLKSAHSETALTPVPDIVAFFKQEFH